MSGQQAADAGETHQECPDLGCVVAAPKSSPEVLASEITIEQVPVRQGEMDRYYLPYDWLIGSMDCQTDVTRHISYWLAGLKLQLPS